MQRLGIAILLFGTPLLSCGDRDKGGDDDRTDTGQVGTDDSEPEGDADTDTDADTDADTDTDADADTDTDTDTDTDVDLEECGDGVDNDDDGLEDCEDPDCAASCPETDCDDGLDGDLDGLADCQDSDCAEVCVEICRDEADNDQDGLTDCEDPDCLDVCLEDCEDGVDNDADGATDCDDDECAGDAACPALYDLSATLSLDFVYMKAGSSVVKTAGYGAIAQAYGTLTLTGTPVGAGTAFTCTGDLRAGSPFLGYTELLYSYAGGCPDCEYTFAFAPSNSGGGLRWSGRCPVDALPTVLLGLGRGDYDMAMYDGGWIDAYTASYHGYGSSFGLWLYMSSYGSIDWSGTY